MVKTKQKKRVSADMLTGKKTATKAKRSNPFEVHTNKEKFNVMGRELKHDRGMPGVSRAKALKRRRDTLGQEFLQKHKANTFRDRRIGERTMSREEAASARFIAERLNQQQQKRKGSQFNLNDDDDEDETTGADELQLTHKGQTLEEIQQFQDTVSDDDDEELGKLDDQFTGAAHFGGGGAPNEQDRKSAIKDLIAEQKRRKDEISKEKDEVHELTHRLDADWKALIPLMAKMSKEDEKKPKPDAYDRALREMIFEPRGDVSDRLKSEADVAKAEKERLERLEKERLERMSGITEEEKRVKHRSADDLDDGYYVQPVLDEKPALAYDIKDKSKQDSDSDDDEDPFGEQKNGTTKRKPDEDEEDAEEEEEEDDEEDDDEDDEEASDEEDDLSDLCGSDDAEEAEASDEPAAKRTRTEHAPKVLTDAERQSLMRKAAAELPYTYDLPDNYEELEALLRNRTAAFQSVIVERMIKCNHPKIAAENRPRLVTLFAYLLQHVNDICAAATGDTVAECFRIVDALAPFLYDLAEINATETAKCFRAVIVEKQQAFRQLAAKRYPSLETLVFLKLAGQLYSVSDYRHPIVTPCYAFAGQLLSQCRVGTRTDIARGLFLCTVLQSYAQQSHCHVPAALNFLAGVCSLAVRQRLAAVVRAVLPIRSDGAESQLLLLADDQASWPADRPTGLCVRDLLDRDPFDDGVRVRLLHGALRLTRSLLEQQSGTVNARYLCEPVDRHLAGLERSRYPAFVVDAADACDRTMAALRARPLVGFEAPERRPKALRLLEPMFDKVYDDKRSHKPGNKDKAVQKGMLRKLKSETRGAIREIRRDNAFLANVQLKRQMAADAERKEKVRRIFAEASIQQGELNSMDRKKKNM